MFPTLLIRHRHRSLQLLELCKITARSVFAASTGVNYYSTMVKQGPRPLVICGPSGSGKSTLLKKLRAEMPDTFALCVSHTTRKPRPGEEDGVDYHYVTVERMQAAIQAGEFLESATFGGNMYGTSKQSVRNVQSQGRVCVLDIEIEGVKQIRATELNPLLVFILPPSIEELERRLRNRNTESEESLRKRLDKANAEIDYGTADGNFHIIIPNHVLTQAYTDLRDFVLRELEIQRSQGIDVSVRRVVLEEVNVENRNSHPASKTHPTI